LKNAKLFLKVNKSTIGVAGAGTMGAGIALIAAVSGHNVIVYDAFPVSLEKANIFFKTDIEKLVAKGKFSAETGVEILARIVTCNEVLQLAPCELIIEAVKEELEVKKQLFQAIENCVSATCILSSNTSSLSITSIAAVLQNPERMCGIHFFNPATIMKLVEIIPALQSAEDTIHSAEQLIQSWGKTTVRAKDNPGFIVNRIARPFYSEAIRMLEESLAGVDEIDTAMRAAGFRMGPFQLMDLIGHDVNYAVTESVWTAYYYEPRFRPSFTQKRMVEAGYLGKKSGRGFYNYSTGITSQDVDISESKSKEIRERILAMLINEAADAWYYDIASQSDIDLAMTLGVNYPKGLFAWAQEWGVENAIYKMNELYEHYQEDRYKLSPGLRKLLET